MSYDNELRGVLFRNKQKRDGKQDPDYRGNAVVEGTDYWLDAWINEPKAGGEKFMAIKFKPKERKPEAQPEAEKPAADDPNDEIPFAFAYALPAGLLAWAVFAATAAGRVLA